MLFKAWIFRRSVLFFTFTVLRLTHQLLYEQITKTMDQFEKNFEELDIQSSVMENSIQQSTGQVMPEDQVDGLMKQVSVCRAEFVPLALLAVTARAWWWLQVADEHGLEFQSQMNDVVVPSVKPVVAGKVEDDLEKRFNELKNQ